MRPCETNRECITLLPENNPVILINDGLKVLEFSEWSLERLDVTGRMLCSITPQVLQKLEALLPNALRRSAHGFLRSSVNVELVHYRRPRIDRRCFVSFTLMY